MQAKWEQIFVSTFVLYLCEILIFDGPVWESDLQVSWLRDPRAGTGPPLTHNTSSLHSHNLYALSEMVVIGEAMSVPCSNPRKGKKSTFEARASEVLHDDWFNL